MRCCILVCPHCSLHLEVIDSAHCVQPALLPASSLAGNDGTVTAVKRFVAKAAEEVDVALDQHWAAAHARPAAEAVTATPSWVPPRATAHSPAPTRAASAAAASAATRPQDQFESPPDNSNTPFVPDFEHLEPLMDASPAEVGGGPEGGQVKSKLERHVSQLNVRQAQASPEAQCASAPSIDVMSSRAQLAAQLAHCVALATLVLNVAAIATRHIRKSPRLQVPAPLCGPPRGAACAVPQLAAQRSGARACTTA
jgi:hypothetical protein